MMPIDPTALVAEPAPGLRDDAVRLPLLPRARLQSPAVQPLYCRPVAPLAVQSPPDCRSASDSIRKILTQSRRIRAVLTRTPGDRRCACATARRRVSRRHCRTAKISRLLPDLARLAVVAGPNRLLVHAFGRTRGQGRRDLAGTDRGRTNGIRQRSRYHGLAAYRRGRIFITERTKGEAPTFGQTIMLPFEVHQRLYLRGLTMGISWRKDNQPYASRMIWRAHGARADIRRLIESCGTYSMTSAEVPSAVAKYLLARALSRSNDPS